VVLRYRREWDRKAGVLLVEAHGLSLTGGVRMGVGCQGVLDLREEGVVAAL